MIRCNVLQSLKTFRVTTNNKQDPTTASKIIKVNIVGFIVTCEKLADLKKEKKKTKLRRTVGLWAQI